MEASPEPNEDGQRLTRYLLGGLAEEERERLQEAYFKDAALFAQLLEAEDDLIDAYVSGALTEDERQRFEQRFGQTGGQLRRVGFARLLSRATDGQPAPALAEVPPRSWPALGRRRSPPYTAAAALAVAALLVAVLGVRWWTGRQTTSPEATLAAHLRPAPPLEPARHAPPPPASVALASLVLRSGMVRGSGGTATLPLSPAIEAVELRLELEPEVRSAHHSSYEAAVQTPAGTEVARQGGLTPSAEAFLVLTVPARVLTGRSYVVLLSDERPDGTRQFLRGYSFEITRQD